MAGSTSQASIIFAWNASPTQTPASSTGRKRPVTTAVTPASAASTASRIISVSGTLPRFSDTVAGLRGGVTQAHDGAELIRPAAWSVMPPTI